MDEDEGEGSLLAGVEETVFLALDKELLCVDEVDDVLDDDGDKSEVEGDENVDAAL